MGVFSSSSGSRRAKGSAAGVVLAILAVMVAAGPAAAATRTPWNTNLVKNPSAEAGAASSDGHATVSIPKWGTYYGFTVVRYGEAGGFPTVAQGNAIGGGSNFFAAGDQEDPYTCGLGYQWIRIVGRNTAIDSGDVKLVISGYVATYDSQSDDAAIDAVAYRYNDYVSGISAVSTAPVTGTNGNFVKVKAAMILPAGTRWILLHLAGSVHEGGYCDAYFDRVSAKLIKV